MTQNMPESHVRFAYHLYKIWAFFFVRPIFQKGEILGKRRERLSSLGFRPTLNRNGTLLILI